MVRLVHLGHQVRDGELDLVGAAPALLVLGDQAEARPEVLEDRRRLRHQHLAVPERGRAERGEPGPGLLQQPLYGGHPAALRVGPTADVLVRDPGVLEGEADELAAPLQAGPVEQLVGIVRGSGHPPAYRGPGAARQRPRGAGAGYRRVGAARSPGASRPVRATYSE